MYEGINAETKHDLMLELFSLELRPYRLRSLVTSAFLASVGSDDTDNVFDKAIGPRWRTRATTAAAGARPGIAHEHCVTRPWRGVGIHSLIYTI